MHVSGITQFFFFFEAGITQFQNTSKHFLGISKRNHLETKKHIPGEQYKVLKLRKLGISLRDEFHLYLHMQDWVRSLAQKQIPCIYLIV
jgi:hypothetical protein